ncbi:MAG: S16 family serine protease [Kofleriaceae bacterium]
MGSSRRALPIALATAFACRTPKPVAAPEASKADHKTYEPLTIKDDAKAPTQAVILGTDERNGSTVVPLRATPSTGVVDALWVKLGSKAGPAGGSTRVKLNTTPNTDGAVQVGVYEELSGGTGPQWRAGVWVSAFVAANTLGKDLTDFTFSAASGGYIDGASASGLMTGGFLATMTGAAIDPAATMTGTINPDGTIGPVGGIPEKFLGAIERGKKKLGYPIGMRIARSAATGRPVDLVQLARERGAEAIEIANVHDAYKLLTGQALPEPMPVAAADMALDEATTRKLEDKYREWQKRLADEWSTLLQLQQGGRMPSMLISMARQAQRRAEQAGRLHAQGLVGAAYSNMLGAWIYAASATDTFDVLTKVQGGDLAGAVRALAKLDALDRQTVDVFKQVGAMQPSTMGDHLRMMGAFQSALRGWGFKVFAADAMRRTKGYLESLGKKSRDQLMTAEAAEEIVQWIGPTVLLIGRTFADTKLAAQRLEFESEHSLGYTCSLPNVQRMSTSFQSASAAGVQYFDTLLVEPLAKSAGIGFDAARTRVAMSEPDYLVAYVLSHLSTADGLPQELKQAWGDGSVAWNLMSLAANQQAYFDAAELIAKHYSLKIRTDAHGRATHIEHDKAFSNMLASAERAARASARAAQIATGAIPVQAKLAYQQATAQRSGDLDDQLAALASYWAASAYSQTAVMLARN